MASSFLFENCIANSCHSPNSYNGRSGINIVVFFKLFIVQTLFVVEESI